MNDKLAPPKCVWCGADWDEPMIDGYQISFGCETCGYGAETKVEFTVDCSSCGRMVYKKEGYIRE